MNFFHFEGAEMTLRHITMSGVRALFLHLVLPALNLLMAIGNGMAAVI